MEGDDIGNINCVFQKVFYINFRQFLIVGVWCFKVFFKVQCFGEDVCISIFEVDVYVMVLQVIEFQIIFWGIDYFWRFVVQFESVRGVIFFFDIKIVSIFVKIEVFGDVKIIVFKLEVLEEMFYNLDFCDILVIGGDLDLRQECLEFNYSEFY